ncbi:hypothetical protein C2W62_06585 [Candidatus Entotheonella serta]|nr:hypothetical protein C2W62_06585 [Candidatus Entotheonella serta]
MRRLNWTALIASVIMLLGLMLVPMAAMADEPQRGGQLRVAIAGDPPSLDMHQEQTFRSCFKIYVPIKTMT